MPNAKTVEYSADDDGDVVQATFSTLTKDKPKRGRKRKRTEDESRPDSPGTFIAAQYTFDENIPLPHYPGHATQEQIDQNIEDYVYKATLSQNDYLREWLPRRIPQIDTLLEMEGQNNTGGECEACTAADARWRCRHCTGRQMLCGDCMWSRHQYQPYHRIELWNDKFFRPAALWEVGLQIYLGHKGKVCPCNSKAAPKRAEQLRPAAVLGEFVEDQGDPDLPDEDHAGNGDDDEDIFEGVDTIPAEVPKAPNVDNFHNPFVCFVDVTGIHYLPVVRCLCPNSGADDNLDYIRMGLFPASFQTVKTVFTEDALRDFRLTNLECKTSAYQYYQKLRRLTSPAFPKSVVNRYRELRRLSRQYRNMKLWKIHGKIYDRGATTTGDANTAQPPPPPSERDHRGTLALFCAACPQPGINLPANWKEDKNT